jgi:branched-chain amino acid transport system permease protein
MKSLAKNIPAGTYVLAAVLLILPLFVKSTQIATLVLIWGLLAMSFNLLLGQTGLLSFGHAALFGTGAYGCALALIHLHLPLAGAMLVGCAASTAIAVLMGIISIQRTGIYFIMLTLACSEILYFVAHEWRSVTGGDDGLSGVPRAAFSLPGISIDLQPTTNFYYFVAVLFIASLVMLRLFEASPVGRVLNAIRENEPRARAVGFSTKPFKVLAFAVSGLFSGLAGCIYAVYLGVVPLDAMHWTTSGKVMMMTILGGASSIFGPILGATIISILEESLSSLWPRWQLLLGLVFTAMVLFSQNGVIGILRSIQVRLRRRFFRRPAAQEGLVHEPSGTP